MAWVPILSFVVLFVGMFFLVIVNVNELLRDSNRLLVEFTRWMMAS